MSTREELKAAVLSLNSNSHEFEKLALDVFRFQYINNPIYKSYVDELGRDITGVTRLEKIPFLPISFFKYHRIQSTTEKASVVFRSSGTTGQLNSEHHGLRIIKRKKRDHLRCLERYVNCLES